MGQIKDILKIKIFVYYLLSVEDLAQILSVFKNDIYPKFWEFLKIEALETHGNPYLRTFLEPILTIYRAS